MLTTDDLLHAVKRSEDARSHVTSVFMNSSLEITLAYWNRLLENSKSICLLLDNDFINEAMVIHRLSIEHFSVIVGLVEGKTSLGDLKNKDLTDLPRQALEVQRGDEKNLSLTPENRKILKDFLSDMDATPAQASGTSVYNLLGSCGLDSVYVNYRLYSIRAAHATLLSGISSGDISEKIQLITDAISLLDLTNAFANKYENKIKQ
ncbi:DUF5677 domain-containing protein [Pseudomonas sp. TNT3]|uniref:DUF5677 domain-containing protein n=1 Tax=Pseudomonas sp. TNT3 TaxID=2654097 RepID=UPI0013909711|nr:DUF5677 domain-containing protein [Pseudomonas sp. TNT3]KAI2685060.1 DUF5677 domain-containing protein [Pseudomonas sp. TNT3]